MKRVFIAIFILLAVGLSACSKEPNVNSGDENMNSSSRPSTESIPPAPSDPDVPKKELEEATEEFINHISLFSEQNVKKVTVELPLPAKIYQSSDPEVIEAWMQLLHKMEFEAVSYKRITGMGIRLLFETDKQTSVGSFMQPYIYTKSQRTLIHIKNYTELASDFQAILIKTGVDPSYV